MTSDTSPLHVALLPTLTLFGYGSAHSHGLASPPSISPPSAWHFSLQKDLCHFRHGKFVLLCSARTVINRLSGSDSRKDSAFRFLVFAPTFPVALGGIWKDTVH